MYRTLRYVIMPKDPLFEYCDKLTLLTNNLYNASLFRIRQMLTVFTKDNPTPNEKEVLDEIIAALAGMNHTRTAANRKRAVKAKLRGKSPQVSQPFAMPTKDHAFLSYPFLDALMRETGNPDYINPDLPRHTAQASIKRAHQDMKNYFASLCAFREDPSKFKAKPNLPGYKRSGGHCLAVLSNQECVIHEQRLKLPKTKETLHLGPVVPEGAKLKQTEVHPYYGCTPLPLSSMTANRPQTRNQTNLIALQPLILA